MHSDPSSGISLETRCYFWDEIGYFYSDLIEPESAFKTYLQYNSSLHVHVQINLRVKLDWPLWPVCFASLIEINNEGKKRYSSSDARDEARDIC